MSAAPTLMADEAYRIKNDTAVIGVTGRPMVMVNVALFCADPGQFLSPLTNILPV